jgi:transposase-like protein/IS1 family transposase
LAKKGQLNCKYCDGKQVKKFGTFENRNGIVQRYFCYDCNKTFSISNNNGMRLDKSKIALVIKLLCESSGIRQASRVAGVHQDTVMKILKISGTIAKQFMQEKAQNLKCQVVAADEVHSWVYARDYAVKGRAYGRGTHFTFFAVDQKSKFIINTETSERSSKNAESFLQTLKQRVSGRFQLNTDAWRGYCGFGGETNAVKRVFGSDIDHVTEQKDFYKLGQFTTRTLAKTTRKRRVGFPDMDKASTSVVERTNLNLRHFARRFTRCTLSFSKKLINHRLAVDLFVWHSNFARKHLSLKSTPALAMGINVAIMHTVDLWNIGVSNN